MGQMDSTVVRNRGHPRPLEAATQFPLELSKMEGEVNQDLTLGKEPHAGDTNIPGSKSFCG